LAYRISLVFAFTINLSLFVLERWGLPRLGRSTGGRATLPTETAAYAVTCIAASYLAAWIVHLTLVPGFLGSPRAFAISGIFALIFTLMFGGIAYAISFYRVSLARAQEIERVRADLAEAELRALRAQIHPHFLFNTLNSIASLIASNPAAAEDTTTRLADVFRYTLRASEREHSRFADELDFLRAYLEIERTRFAERLRIDERIEPGLDEARIPSLLLQPLVENAVRYAVSPRPEGGRITISARREGDRLVIDIADDGPGIEADRPPQGTGFGLHAVRERLRAAGPPHAFELLAPTAGGTHLRITLPWVVPPPRAAHPLPTHPPVGGPS
jgi:LytS/YehU family sensor histidine kinase